MSTLRTNALEGMDAKNSITIVAGAGNITTTNVQEGLCKAWCHYTTASSFTNHDSFNVASLTDEGAGMCKCNFTSVMVNDDFAKAMAQGENHSNDQDASTAYMYMQSVNNSHAAADSVRSSQTAFGDLA